MEAKDIMNQRIVAIRDTQTIETAAKIMFKKGFSQLPVFRGNKICATISESLVFKWLDAPARIVHMKRLSLKKLGLKLDRALPMVDIMDSEERIKGLLRRNNAVIVTRQGKPKGIITKSDFMKLLMKEKYVKTWR